MTSVITTLDMALAQAALGISIIPIHYDPVDVKRSKVAALYNWVEEASTNPEKITRWFKDQVRNIGNAMGEHHVGIDFDVKPGKSGEDSRLQLESEGKLFPATRTHYTPSGGYHFIYRTPAPLRTGANTLGPGIDSRGRGGYLVGPGSITPQGIYTVSDDPIADAPQWLVDLLGNPPSATRSHNDIFQVPENIDRERAIRMARHWLKTAPVAVEGSGGDDHTIKIAMRLRDFGIGFQDTYNLLSQYWNPRCEPSWSETDLQGKVLNAYHYAKSKIGIANPQVVFDTVEQDPNSKDAIMAQMNLDYAYVIQGGKEHIMHFTDDVDGKPEIKHLAVPTFYGKTETTKVVDGKRKVGSGPVWFQWEGRKSYADLVFAPGRDVPDRFYNLWEGFSVESYASEAVVPDVAREGFQRYLDHISEAICGNDTAYFNWVMGWFAHIIQKPWEKPQTALVLRGEKGVGKNIAVETIGALLKSYFTLVAAKRFLMGNFNSHLDRCLFLCFDEAFWSGDKAADGILKNLISGDRHVIEYKGKEHFTVANLTRVAVLGNESWLVPASRDERRYAVFDVANLRKQDTAFFGALKAGMELGGDRLLFSYLQQFSLDGLDFNTAPKTRALLDQKIQTLDPVHQWWLDCLTEGKIVASDFGMKWPEMYSLDQFFGAYRRYIRDRGIKKWIPDNREFIQVLRSICDGLKVERTDEGSVCVFPKLAECRKAFEQFVYQPLVWP